MNIERTPKFIIAKENIINSQHLMNVSYKKEDYCRPEPGFMPKAWLQFTMQSGDILELWYGENLTKCNYDLERIKEFITNEEDFLKIEE